MRQRVIRVANLAATTHIGSKEAIFWFPVIVAAATVLSLISWRFSQSLSDHRGQLAPKAPVVTPTPAPPPPPPPPPPPDPVAVEAEALQKLLDDFQATQTVPFYIYAKNLKTGAIASIRPDISVPSGSIYKMFLANQVYKLNEAGKLDLNTYVQGTGYTFAGCTYQMIQYSLNLCGEQVRLHLGAVKQTEALNKQGYTCTNLMRGDAAHTCAQDIALIYQRLYDGGYYSKEHTAQYLEYLRNQHWRFRIPTGIPTGLLISGDAVTYNKTGDVFAFANDSAIVKGEKTDFILVILSGSWPKVFPDSSYEIRHLTGLVYNFMNHTDHSLPY